MEIDQSSAKPRGMYIVRRGNEWILLGNKAGEFSLERVAFETGYRVKQFADRMEVGGRHLQDLFNRDIGIPPKQWLRELRMVVAARMLTAGRRSPETGKLLGFGSASNFAREFVAAYGMSPGNFHARMFLAGGWMRPRDDDEEESDEDASDDRFVLRDDAWARNQSLELAAFS